MINHSRAKAALSNLFVGDALSMPVHWYYNPGDIIRQFGKHGVQAMQPAPDFHPSSIMKLHSTTSGGRRNVESKTTSREIVGDVILKGKQEYWGQTGMHYHHGLPAGENTLNTWWARELMEYMLDTQAYSLNTWAQRYIDFMTAEPARHPDTYAESCHRGYFANWADGKPPLECGAVTHDTPSMGALVTVAPLAIALCVNDKTTSDSESLDSVSLDAEILDSATKESIKKICREHVWLTHPDNNLMHVVDAYVELLINLLSDEPGQESAKVRNPDAVLAFLQSAINATGQVDLHKLIEQPRGDAAVVGRQYSLACYITDSWPSVCYLAAKYYNTPDKALIINTNLGGENAHRGSVLGTIVGAASGVTAQNLFDQLTHAQDVENLIDRLVSN